MRYDNRFEPRTKGMDYNHLAFTEMNVGVDSLYYSPDGMKVRLRACNMKEKSGFALSSLTFVASMDADRLHVHGFNLLTPYSTVSADVDMDFTTFDKTNPGKARAAFKASVGADDVLLLAGEMLPRELKRQLPKQPVTLQARLEGNTRHCHLTDVYADVPSLVRLTLEGDVCHLDNTGASSLPGRQRASARPIWRSWPLPASSATAAGSPAQRASLLMAWHTMPPCRQAASM